MRQDILVNVPQENQKDSVSYSMFVSGVVKENPGLSDNKGCFIIDGNKVFILYYYFQGFSRAYVVMGSDPEGNEDKAQLPGVEGDLFVLYTAIGKDFKTLQRVLKYLTKYDKKYVYYFPSSFWFRLCALITGKKAYKSNVLHLLNKTKWRMELYER